MNLPKFDQPGDAVVRKIYDSGKWTILFVGRVIPNKKFEDVIKVFNFYKKYFNPNSQLILAGDYRGMERYYAALQRLVDELDLNDVHLTGHVEFTELVSYFKLADVYLSMSEHEGFGVPLLEGFHNQIPVVALAAGAVEETMNGGGIVLRKKDFFQTAALLHQLQDDTDFRTKIISSQNEALKKYERQNIAEVLMGHIERVNQS
jgi:glycosyltransferase involved in cell wall biosynthesis